MLYRIYEEYFPEVEKKLNRIAKKCVKHGNDFIFNVVGEEIKERENALTNHTEYLKFILIEVEGTAKIDNWECIAVLENHASGNIIRRINTEMDMPERFQNTENICEHCQTKRARNNLFVIHNVETDEWKQVGGSCLKLYTGGLNMEYIVAWMDGITELEAYDGNVGIYSKPHYVVEDILAYATEIIDKMGYFNTSSNVPTKQLISWLMFFDMDKAILEINKDLANWKINFSFSKNDFHKPETKGRVEKIIEYYNGLKDDCEFIHNIKVMLEEKYILSKNFGFLAYLPAGYNKHIQKEVERAQKIEEAKKSEYFGEIGKRYKDIPIEYVEVITSWYNQYGTTYIHKIALTDGTILIWKTSNDLWLENDEEYDKITFTVKDHNDYKGQKQTEVTRCKVTIKKV